MQKYIQAVVVLVFVAFASWTFYQKKLLEDDLRKTKNLLAETQQLVKTTESSWMSAALESNNLKSENKKLQKVIEKNKQDIFAITKLKLEWQAKYFDIKNATGSIVDAAGSQPSSLTSECESCFSAYRSKVQFEKEQDGIKISGYTLSNPPEASVELSFTKSLELELILTKDSSGNFAIHLASESNLIKPESLTLLVDPSILSRKWYERIAFGADLQASQFGVSADIKALYGAKENLYVGPSVSLNVLFDGKLVPFYGASVVYMPFMK